MSARCDLCNPTKARSFPTSMVTLMEYEKFDWMTLVSPCLQCIVPLISDVLEIVSTWQAILSLRDMFCMMPFHDWELDQMLAVISLSRAFTRVWISIFGLLSKHRWPNFFIDNLHWTSAWYKESQNGKHRPKTNTISDCASMNTFPNDLLPNNS